MRGKQLEKPLLPKALKIMKSNDKVKAGRDKNQAICAFSDANEAHFFSYLIQNLIHALLPYCTDTASRYL